MKKNKTVYIALAADILHQGHFNLIHKASKLGKIIIGLLTDKAIVSYKRLPFFNYDQRLTIVKNLKNISQVIPQNSLDYTENLQKIKPNYVVHGDDWKKGVLKRTRQKVIKQLKNWSGKLVEYPYYKKISSSTIKNELINSNINFETNRIENLKRLIETKKIVRIIDTHNALIGMIIENLKLKKKNKIEEFDGFWSSSLTDSLVRAKPDNQSVDLNTRIQGLGDIMDCTSKPLLFDADNGGRIEHIPYLVKALERQGVSGLVIEDKIGLKKNSLFKNQENVQQDSIKNFCKKIKAINKSKRYRNFMTVARIESFILGKGLNDALKRAESYSKAGADAILIHSKDNNPSNIFKFAKIFKKSKNYKPMIAVPSSYSQTREKDLIKQGFKIVIYANQLLRATYPATVDVAKQILKNQRSFEIESKITPISQIITLV